MLLVAADGSTQGIDITPSKVRRSEAARGLRAHNSFFLFSCQVGGVYLEWNLGVGERTLSFCFSFANDAQFSKRLERSKDVILTRPSEEVKGNLIQLLSYFFHSWFPSVHLFSHVGL